MNPTEPPRDKASYSYKEMMDQLRQQQNGGGRDGSSSQPVRVEVIKGEDGSTQVAEVRRRRKRRSHQPKKIREQRIKMLRRLAVFGVVPLVLLLIGGYMLMLSRVRGEGFRNSASARISELVGADIEFGRFHLRGLNLGTRKAVLTGAPDGLLREGEISALRARLQPSTMLSSDWRLGFVQAVSGSFRFGRPAPGAGREGIGGLSSADREIRRPFVAAGLGLDSAPKHVDLSGIKVADCDLFWDGRMPATEPFVAASNLSTGDFSSPAVGLSLRGGKLAIPTWPEFGIEAISGDVAGGVYNIRRSSLLHVGNGAAALTGKVSARGDGAYQLAVEYSDIELREIIHPYWAKEQLSGRIDGDLQISGALAQAGSLKAEGGFSSRGLVFSGTVLKRLSLGLGESQLARVQFRNFEGRYRRSAGKMELYDLRGEHPSLLQLRGNIVVHTDDGSLSGRLELGLPDADVSKIEGGKPAFFGPEKDGFSWVTVTLSGLIDEPREDLTPRLERAREEFLRESGRALPGTRIPTLPTDGDGGGALEKTFDELIKP